MADKSTEHQPELTLDEAIKHARLIAKSCGDTACGKHHEQLVDWLIELKCLRGEKETKT